MSIQSISYESNLRNLSTGYKINSASDDAAGLAISEKMLSQINGYDRGTQNAEDGQSMINTAEGGLSGINESLQRIRELAVQASNGIYSQDERAMMQQEVEQLKMSITDQSKGTQFNTKKLLDGSNTSINLATNPQGTGMTMQMVDVTLEKLGIADFDLTKDFDINDIDSAINKVSSARSNLGATSNRLDYTINYNLNANENLTAARSRIIDTDFVKEITDFKTKQILEQYSYFAQTQQTKAQAGLLALFNN